MPSNENRPALGLILGFIGVVIFGGTVPATRLAVQEIDPWFITFGRAAVAGSIAIVLLVILRKSLPRRLWRTSAFASLCLVIGFPGALGVALKTIPASHGGVALGLLPISTAVFAAIFAGERPSPVFWFWSFIGAALVVTFSFRDGQFGFETGDLWLALAILFSSIGYVFSAKLSREKPGWEIICWQLVIAAPLVLTGTIFFWDATLFQASTSAKISFAYVSLFSMLIGFFAWNAGLALGGIAHVSQIQLLQTFVTLAIAAIVLKEAISLETILFAVGICSVILFARKAKVSKKLPIPADTA